MSSQRDLQSQLQTALTECERLQQEVQFLKGVIASHSIPLPEPTCSSLPESAEIADSAAPASPQEKIALFRSLFRGREDVHAERWEAKDSLSGYRPACERNWDAVLKSKPEDRKKVDLQTRKLLPLTDQVIRLHLTGKKTIGIYPLLTDETCWLLAADFDKKTWQDDAAAFITTCREMRVPAYLERSRSGRCPRLDFL
jgi:hypothetical protein